MDGCSLKLDGGGGGGGGGGDNFMFLNSGLSLQCTVKQSMVAYHTREYAEHSMSTVWEQWGEYFITY